MAHRTNRIDKFFLLFLVCFVGFLVLYLERERILGWMMQYSLLWGLYSHIYAQISERTLLGLFYASVFGSLFFIFLPIEALFIYYSELPYPKILVVAIILFGNLIGLAVNYWLGRIFGLRLVSHILKEKFVRFCKTLKKWGGWVIFLGNIVIFPIEPISLLIGAGKYPFRRFLLISACGKLIKFGLILLAQHFLAGYVTALLA